MTVGRFAGRVSNGTFTLDGKKYYTDKNMGAHTIHGGKAAFDKKQWSYRVLHQPGELVGVEFSYVSPHMENGFPAEVQCLVRYTILDRQPDALKMEYEANVTDASPAPATIMNLFNHCYWNINGIPAENETKKGDKERWAHAPQVTNLLLRLPNSSTVADTDGSAIPSGEIVPVSGTPLDFQTTKRVGKDILQQEALKRSPPGFDHPYFIDGYTPLTSKAEKANPKQYKKEILHAEVQSPISGINFKVYSTFPTMWVYSANNMKENASGERGERFRRYSSLCLEPQYPPDAANHAAFKPQSVVVRRGEPYYESITNVFTVADAPSRL
ncbi:aldose 1-epimerase [Angomonas deanei]|nr:aldose 1-epimerase [Angomonas deanei]|eukprot:EPY42971.1 aldose 1-epimerase [Angomonas deanei]